MSGPTGWRGKILAVALLIAVGMGAYELVMKPIALALIGQRESIADLKFDLARYRALDAERAGLAAHIAEMKQRESRHGDYIEAGSETLAGAKIQTLLGTFFERYGATQRSVQTLTSETADGNVRINVRTQFSVGTDGLYRLLHEVETRAPLLFVKSVDIRRKQNRRRRREQDTDAAQQAGVLDVRLDLYAYLREPAL